MAVERTISQALSQAFRLLINRNPALKNYVSRFKDFLRVHRPAKRSNFGFYLSARADMIDGSFESDDVLIFLEALDLCDTLINVGANVGYYSCLALHKGAAVVAIEPDPTNYSILVKNFAANGWNSAIALQMAASNQRGIASLHGSDTGASLIPGWAGQTSRRSIMCLKLDDLGSLWGSSERLLILIDVEGHELEVLEGALDILNSSIHVIFIVEINISEHQPNGLSINPRLYQTFDLFFSRNFKCYALQQAKRVISAREVLEISNTGIDTIKSHNFMFVHPNLNYTPNFLV